MLDPKPMTVKKHILLVDDDQAVTQMLAMLLETRGYDVSVARSGQEALTHKRLVKTNLILLDLVLPDQEGYEVCRKFKTTPETANIPIIVLSGRVNPKNKVEVLHVGADDYLTKPFDYEELVARIEAVLRRSSSFSKETNPGQDSIIHELRRIIKEEQVVPHFQPIYHIQEKRVLGLEALCRPKTNSLLSNPELLFKAALEYGAYQELEILSWRKALEYAAQVSLKEQLFLNCNPYLVEGAKFMMVKELFEVTGIKIENVCLEITERSAITDYKTFYDRLARFREHGFRFAVDDVGGGYASLESIVETKPEVIKIDRHIIMDISKDNFKRSIVKFIVSFCRENHILCIAEGIETKEDFDVVLALGVDAVQGYYLQKPAPVIDMTKISAALQTF